MTWEEYEELIYLEVAWRAKRDIIARAIASFNLDRNGAPWPGTLRIANKIMEKLDVY